MRYLFLVLFLTAPSCTGDDDATECGPVVAFMGPGPATIRYEQLSRREQDTGVRVDLQPGDAGLRLRVYPTTDQDIWDNGGFLRFLGATGAVIYEAEDLCVADFAARVWIVPAAAVAVELDFPNDTIATILFTVVIES